MNLQPKTRFQALPAAKSHADLVVNESFRDALSFALLEMQYHEPPTSDPKVAEASFHRLCGAREFIQTLLNLCESPSAAKPVPRQNLQHQL